MKRIILSTIVFFCCAVFADTPDKAKDISEPKENLPQKTEPPKAISEQKPIDGMLEFSSIGMVNLPFLDVRFKYPQEFTNWEKITSKGSTAIFGEEYKSSKNGFIKNIVVSIWPQTRTTSEGVREETSQDDFIKVFIWPGQKIEKKEKAKYAGIDGYTYTFSGPLINPDEVPPYKIMHFVPVGNCIVAIQCCLNADSDDKELLEKNFPEALKDAEKVFKKIGESIEFRNKDEFIESIMANMIKAEFEDETYAEVFKPLVKMKNLNFEKNGVKLSLDIPAEWKEQKGYEDEDKMFGLAIGYKDKKGREFFVANGIKFNVEDKDKFLKPDKKGDMGFNFSDLLPKEEIPMLNKLQIFGRFGGVVQMTACAYQDTEKFSLYFLILADKKILNIECFVLSDALSNGEEGTIIHFVSNLPIFKLIADSIKVETLDAKEPKTDDNAEKTSEVKNPEKTKAD